MNKGLWDGPASRTWLLHAGFGIVETLLAALILWLVGATVPWWVPATFPIYYYLKREIEGMLYTGRVGSLFEITDRVFDVTAPTAAALVTARLVQLL